MKTEYTGTVHGRTIELTEAPDLPDGQRVTVVLQPAVVAREAGCPGSPDEEASLGGREGLMKAFGGWAEDAEELGRYLEWNRQQRKLDRPELPE